MSTRFDACLPLILKYEGGWVNNPADHGGATNFGVTQRVYSGWLVEHGLSDASVKDITPAQVSAIYRAGYWDAVRGDNLPEPLDLVVFDAGVNSGPSRSIRWLQAASRVPADGVIGPKTLAAVLACPPKTMAALCLDQREAFLRQIATHEGQGQFLKGWLRRVGDLRLRIV